MQYRIGIESYRIEEWRYRLPYANTSAAKIMPLKLRPTVLYKCIIIIIIIGWALHKCRIQVGGQDSLYWWKMGLLSEVLRAMASAFVSYLNNAVNSNYLWWTLNSVLFFVKPVGVFVYWRKLCMHFDWRCYDDAMSGESILCTPCLVEWLKFCGRQPLDTDEIYFVVHRGNILHEAVTLNR